MRERSCGAVADSQTWGRMYERFVRTGYADWDRRVCATFVGEAFHAMTCCSGMSRRTRGIELGQVA